MIFTAHVLELGRNTGQGIVVAVNIDIHDNMLARLGLTIRGLPTIKEQAIGNIDDHSEDFTYNLNVH